MESKVTSMVHGDGSDRHHVAARKVRAEYMRQYRAAHCAEIAEKARAYYAAHCAEIAEKARAYYAAHRAKIAEKHRAYYAACRAERRFRRNLMLGFVKLPDLTLLAAKRGRETLEHPAVPQ